MTFAARLDDQGRVLIPLEIRQSLGLQEDTQVELEVLHQLPATTPPRDTAQLQAALEHYGGSKRESFLAEGFTSVEQHIDDLRERSPLPSPRISFLPSLPAISWNVLKPTMLS